MNSTLISSVRFTVGTKRDLGSGLLGYLVFKYGDVVLDGLVLRRTAKGSLAVSWPVRRSRGRRTQHSVVRPSNDAARRRLEQEILAQLREQGGLA